MPWDPNLGLMFFYTFYHDIFVMVFRTIYEKKLSKWSEILHRYIIKVVYR